MLAKKRKKRRQSLKRGQAMVEYSLISHALLVLGAGVTWGLFTEFMNALDIYYGRLFQVLTDALR